MISEEEKKKIELGAAQAAEGKVVSREAVQERVVNNFPVWAVSFLASPNLRFTMLPCFGGHLA